jgi:hypothetical protein
VCDWLVTVKVRGTLVVSVTCKNRQKRKWETQHKTRKPATPITTTTAIITITITITIIKKMKTTDTGDRGENEYKLLFVSTLFFPPGTCV